MKKHFLLIILLAISGSALAKVSIANEIKYNLLIAHDETVEPGASTTVTEGLDHLLIEIYKNNRKKPHNPTKEDILGIFAIDATNYDRVYVGESSYHSKSKQPYFIFSAS